MGWFLHTAKYRGGANALRLREAVGVGVSILRYNLNLTDPN